MSKLWKDVRNGRVLAVSPDAIHADTPTVPTPATTVVGKLPDRTISTDVRAISDLGTANLVCNKADYPDIQLADIEAIDTREITTERTRPNTEAV